MPSCEQGGVPVGLSSSAAANRNVRAEGGQGLYVLVDAETDPGAVSLAEPDDCGRFHVAVHGHTQAPAVDDSLQSSGTGWLDGDGNAYVRVERVRSLAAGRVGDDWPERFEAMLQYAAGKGWLSDDGEAIRAHLEWQ